MKLLLLIALQGLTATAQLTGFSVVQKGTPGDTTLFGTNARTFLAGIDASCNEGIDCDGACITITNECCGYGDGSYCGFGTSCSPNGCCEYGEDCSEVPAECALDQTLCGTVCIDDDGECCDPGTAEWCPAGATCIGNGLCETPDESVAPGSSDAASTTKADGTSVVDATSTSAHITTSTEATTSNDSDPSTTTTGDDSSIVTGDTASQTTATQPTESAVDSGAYSTTPAQLLILLAPVCALLSLWSNF